MNDKTFSELKLAIESEYDEKLRALQLLRGVIDGPYLDLAAPAARRRRHKGIPLSGEQKLERQRAYAKKSYHKMRATKSQEGAKGIPAAKFRKLLVKGPVAAGGNGDE